MFNATGIEIYLGYGPTGGRSEKRPVWADPTPHKAPCAATSLTRPDAAVSTQQSGVGAGAAAVHASLTELSLHGNELR